MKAIKWTIMVLYVLIPVLIFWALLFDHKSPHFVLNWCACLFFGSVVAHFYIRNAEKFSKWFDSKLK